jgi:hypothetical protein
VDMMDNPVNLPADPCVSALGLPTCPQSLRLLIYH